MLTRRFNLAIAYARVTIHSRTRGHSAVAAAAYRSGLKLVAEKTGVSHTYTGRKDVQFSEILLPDEANQKYLDRTVLWNEIERIEKRKDAQLCKDIVIALPDEIDLMKQIELAKRFADFHFIRNGLPADIAIHDNGSGNPHAHILVPFRRLGPDGFHKHKARDLNPEFARGNIISQDYWGEQWRDFQNEFFFRKNIDLKVDLNHIIPEEHEGGRFKQHNKYVQQLNIMKRRARYYLAIHQLDNFINLLSLKASVFSRRDIETLLHKSVLYHDKKFLKTIEKILSHKEVIELGSGDDGQMYYTTRQHYKAEARLFKQVEKLKAYDTDYVLTDYLRKISDNYNLNYEQIFALKHIISSPKLSVVIGKPGTGKTYMMKALKEYYDGDYFKLWGAAIASKAARGLQEESGIKSFTLASLNYKLAKGKLKLSKRDIIIVDEAGMVDFASYSNLINYVSKAKAKLVLIGDPDQLKPIGKGDLFRGIAQRTGYLSMSDIRRQRDINDRMASIALSKGKVELAISHYEQQNQLSFLPGSDKTLDAAIDNYMNDIQSKKKSLMMSFKRVTVSKLNRETRKKLKSLSLIDSKDYYFNAIENTNNHFQDRQSQLESKLLYKSKTKSSYIKLPLSLGERIIFKKKSFDLNIDNGDIGTITSITKDGFHVNLDKGEVATINRGEYKHFDYAYAITVHKAQGATIDNAHLIVDSKFWDKHLSFVGMTRHRKHLNIYVDQSQIPDKKALIYTFSRSPIKDNVIDWPLDAAMRMGFNPDRLIGKAINYIAGKSNDIKDKWNYIVSLEEKNDKNREKTPSLASEASLQKTKTISSGSRKNLDGMEHELLE